MKSMKKLFLFCAAACLSVIASAQKVYFLYLQTEDQSPFYVRMADKIYSSAVSGFLILPNLTDSTYSLNVGFAKSTKPEIKFAVTISQGDKGYLLKNLDDGLALFDMQALTLIKAAMVGNNNTAYETRSDKFSSILSRAADDPGLLKVPVTKKEDPKLKPEEREPVTVKVEQEKTKDTIVAAPAQSVEAKLEKKEDLPKTESVARPVEEVKQTAVKEEPSNSTVLSADYKRSIVSRYSESSTTEGFGIIYFDRGAEKTDTVRILIPPSKLRLTEEIQTANLSEIKKKDEAIIAEPSSKVDSGTEVKKEVIENKPSNRSGCAGTASEKDFLKLRKNMAAKSSDEEMIDEAKKSFRSKCFSSEQVRYLSTLFLTSAAKYQFLDASFNHIADKENFAALQSEIKDDYYLKRFKALVGE